MRVYRSAICISAVLLLLAPARVIRAAGFAKNPNFQVLTPELATKEATREYAAEVLQAAEFWRSEIARQWLGRELPSGAGHTIITVSFHADRDRGLTWAKDHPQRRSHTLYLSTSPELALGTTLAHEMVHVVLATQFPHPNRLPAWLEEGIAGQYDEAERQQIRLDELKRLIRTRRWPSFTTVLNASNISATDTEAYTMATLITSLLLQRDSDHQKLFEFALFGKEHSWDAALTKYYGIEGVDQLHLLWRRKLL